MLQNIIGVIYDNFSLICVLFTVNEWISFFCLSLMCEHSESYAVVSDFV